MKMNEKPSITLDVDQMGIDELRGVVKILMRLMNFESNRITHLQDRVLMLEIRKRRW
jgi:hypothetical protein